MKKIEMDVINQAIDDTLKALREMSPEEFKTALDTIKPEDLFIKPEDILYQYMKLECTCCPVHGNSKYKIGETE